MKLKHAVKQLMAASAVVFLLSAAPRAHAATFTVDRADDASVSACSAASNDCGLRGAITKANATAGADTINFDATVFAAPGPHVISLDTELPHLSSDVTVTGPGANVLTVKEAGTNHVLNLFDVNDGVSATISGLTLSNGLEGIVNFGALTVTNCTMSDNRYEGIINYNGTVTATNCTMSGNTYGIADSSGTSDSVVTATNCTLSGNFDGIICGNCITTLTNCTLSGNTDFGIRNNGDSNGTATLTNCTLSGNDYGIGNSGTVTATNCTVTGNDFIGIVNNGPYDNSDTTMTNCTVSGNAYYGIYNYGGPVTLQNTIVAGNKTNVHGGFTDGGHNITSSAAAAGLDPAGLQDNGGPTKTIALIAGSPAIDAGNSTLTTDQRGFQRPQGSAPDIGAFEFGSVPTLSVNNPRSQPEGSADISGSVTFDITLSAPSTQSVTVNYQTRDGINNPATAGVDYVEKHGKLTFAPGETLKRVTIQFIGDDKAEAKETFFLDLNTPANAAIADGRGVGTIVNDDATPNIFEDEPSQ